MTPSTFEARQRRRAGPLPGLSARDAPDALRDLLARLGEEEQAGGELVGLARQKQRLLVAGDAGALLPLVQAEQAMLAALSRSEVRRAADARALAAALGLSGGASLEQIAVALDRERASLLREAGRRIARSLTELQALNAQNVQLIQQSLAFVNFSLGVLGRAVGQVETYSPGGRHVRPNPAQHALNREG